MRTFFAALLLAFTFSIPYTHAQVHVCGTDVSNYQAKVVNPKLVEEERAANERTLEVIDQLRASRAQGKKAGILYIPVVFHVIHNGGSENITQAQIMDQLAVLNNDFRKVNGTLGGSATNGKAVDMEIEFRLAQIDPNGNRHDGINRVQSSLTEEARDNVKSLSYWPSNRYLNIWIVKTIRNFGADGIVLGYAQFPYSMNSTPQTDGIVMRADYTGTIITGNATNAGRTLTHEVGHWIGLYHTFQDGCVGTNANTCASQGDWVCDTPPVENATNGCLTTRTSCNGQAMIENYMDYMDGRCTNTYTQGQKDRALAQMNIYRSNISSTTNLQSTGITAAGLYAAMPNSPIKAPYVYGFEDADVTAAGWRIQNLNNGSNGWKSDATAYSGSRSIGFRNFNINTSVVLNSRDEFNSPLIDLTTLSSATLSFKVAYARMATATNDALDVFISGDFGRTETRLIRCTASNMERPDGPTTSAYVPASGDWRTISLDLTPYLSMTNARIRFEFLNRKGNNIFIDDFVISNVTGLSETLKKDLAFNVYPNPMTDIAYAEFELKQSEQVSVTVVDLVGRKVKTIQEGQLQTGVHTLAINKALLTPGIYLVKVETAKGAFSHKLVVN